MGACPSHEAQANSGLFTIRFFSHEICLVPLTSRYFPNSTCSAFQCLYRARCFDRVLFTFLNTNPGTLQTLPGQERELYWDLIIAALDGICKETNQELRDAVRANPNLLRPVPCAVVQITKAHAPQQNEKNNNTKKEPLDSDYFSLTDDKMARVIGFFNLRNTNPTGAGCLTGGVFANMTLGESTGMVLECLSLATTMYVEQCKLAGIVLPQNNNNGNDAAAHDLVDRLEVSQLIQHHIEYEFLVSNYNMVRFTVEKMCPLLALVPGWEKYVRASAAGGKLFIKVSSEFVNMGIPCLVSLVDVDHTTNNETAAAAATTPAGKKDDKKKKKDAAAAVPEMQSTRKVKEVRQPFQRGEHPMHLPYMIQKVMAKEYKDAKNSSLDDPQWRFITPKLCLWQLRTSAEEDINKIMREYPRPADQGYSNYAQLGDVPEPVKVPLLGVVPDFAHKAPPGPLRQWAVENAVRLFGRPLKGDATNARFEFQTMTAFLEAAAAHAANTALPTSDRWSALSHRGGLYRIETPDSLSHVQFQVRIPDPWFLSHPEVVQQLQDAEAKLKEEEEAKNVAQSHCQLEVHLTQDDGTVLTFSLLLRHARANQLQELDFEGPMAIPQSRSVSAASFATTQSSSVVEEEGDATAADVAVENAVQSLDISTMRGGSTSSFGSCGFEMRSYRFNEDRFKELEKAEEESREVYYHQVYCFQQGK